MPSDKAGKFSIERTLIQGGAFVFSGKKPLLEFYDSSSGAHVELQTLMDVALTGRSK